MLDPPNHFAFVTRYVPAFDVAEFVFASRFVQNDVQVFNDLRQRRAITGDRAEQAGK